MSVINRLLGKVKRVGKHWIWQGSIGGHGYGQININRRPELTHRVAYRIFIGPIPPEMNVLHHCDIRTCIRPECLFLGTHADNVADKVAKGRQMKGEAVPSAKLSRAMVQQIRRWTDEGLSINEISQRVPQSVSYQMVWHVVKGNTWRSVA